MKIIENDVFFVVYAPAFRKTSGGIYALHALAEDMYELGCKVGMLAEAGMPNGKVPLVSLEQIREIQAAGILIAAIYPEIVTSNVLGADYSVWWLLNYPGFINKNWNGDYGWADRICAFGPEVAKDCRCDSVLIYPLYDTDLFFDDGVNSREEIVCYTNRIFSVVEEIQPPVDATVFISPSQNLNYKQLRDIFRKAKVVFSFEWSGTLVIAQLCGAPVIFIESDILKKSLHHGELFDYGSAWGYSAENIELAKKTLNNVKMIHEGRKKRWQADLIDEIEFWIKEAKAK